MKEVKLEISIHEHVTYYHFKALEVFDTVEVLKITSTGMTFLCCGSDMQVKEFPEPVLDTADFLIEHKVKVLGTDTLGIEPYSHSDFKVLKALLSKGLAFIEDLASLDQLTEGKKYLIAALPLKIFKGNGAMARVNGHGYI